MGAARGTAEDGNIGGTVTDPSPSPSRDPSPSPSRDPNPSPNPDPNPNPNPNPSQVTDSATKTAKAVDPTRGLTRGGRTLSLALTRTLSLALTRTLSLSLSLSLALTLTLTLPEGGG